MRAFIAPGIVGAEGFGALLQSRVAVARLFSLVPDQDRAPALP
jgi:hypothetical protein